MCKMLIVLVLFVAFSCGDGMVHRRQIGLIKRTETILLDTSTEISSTSSLTSSTSSSTSFSTPSSTPSSTSSSTSSSVSLSPITGTPDPTFSTGFSLIGANGCAGVSIIGSTIFFNGGAIANAGQTLTCTAIIGVQNGESVKQLTFIHNIDILLARKIQEWCWVDKTLSYCVQGPNSYVQCNNCVYTTMGDQYYTASFKVSYSGCGINNSPDSIIYLPDGDAQASWRKTDSIRHEYQVNCESTDTISVTISLSTTEAGTSLGKGWNYASSSYISENTVSLSRNVHTSSPSSGTIITFGLYFILANLFYFLCL